MEKITYLYLVTCENSSGTANINVYVVATDFNKAKEKALEEMKTRGYSYSFCSNCKVLASTGYDLKILIL
jgi:hypothetical protein